MESTTTRSEILTMRAFELSNRNMHENSIYKTPNKKFDLENTYYSPDMTRRIQIMEKSIKKNKKW